MNEYVEEMTEACQRLVTHLIALFALIIAIWVRKMNVTAGVVHHPFYIVSTLADYVRVFRVRDFYLHRHSRALYTAQDANNAYKINMLMITMHT